jgi:glycerol uptake facilitator-like aquaporin
MGFGFVALSYGIAIGFSIGLFHYSSAFLNPAAVLAGAIVGKIDWIDVIPLMLADFAGGFVGAVLAYLVYYQHYQITPTVESEHDETHVLLRSRHFKGQSSLSVSSHDHSFGKLPLISREDRKAILHKASIQADQSAKLSTFANRPAIKNPFFNFLTEVLCTFILVLGAELISNRIGSFVDDAGQVYARGLLPFMYGFYFFALIVTFGNLNL